VAVIRCVGRGLHFDANVWVDLSEPVELQPNRFAFFADGAAGEGEHVRIPSRATHGDDQCDGAQRIRTRSTELVKHEHEWCT
jgi:hypothetical protein